MVLLKDRLWAHLDPQALWFCHQLREIHISWAMMSPDSEKWLQAMKSEMQSMYDNQVWNFVDPPKVAKVIGCKWVHKIKHDMTFKSRLVANRFQTNSWY